MTSAFAGKSTLLAAFALLIACAPAAQTSETPRRSGKSQGADQSQHKKDDDTNKRDDQLDDETVDTSQGDDDEEDEDKDEDTQQQSDGSGGTGGRTGTYEERFTASNGKSSTWKVTIPDDVGTKTYGLNIYLHGDGGGDYSWVFSSNVKSALKLDLIGVVVMAPNAGRRWYDGGIQNAKFLDELIQNEILKKYNIDKSRIYFTGTSGGSQFLTGQFIPNYGAKYNSGALLLCGGPKNWQSSINSTPEFISKFRLYFYSGTSDFLYSQIVAGIAYYKGLGMNVDSEMIPGGSHCNFPGNVQGAIGRKLELIVR